MEGSQLNNIIKSSKNILLISHINPDGDTLGSICAMYGVIKDNFHKECEMLCVSKIPKIYEYLPNVSKIKKLEDFDTSREFDLVINVDIAAIDRAGEAKILFDKAKFRVNLDHHKTNRGYADLNIKILTRVQQANFCANFFKNSDGKFLLVPQPAFIQQF